MVSDLERYYYRCPECDQAFYWFDWVANPKNAFLEVMTKKAAEIMVLFQQ